MKTNYILLIIALCFSLNVTAQMETNNGGDAPWDDIQNTLTEFFTDASSKINKLSRWYWLRQNDIRMEIEVDYDSKTFELPAKIKDRSGKGHKVEYTEDYGKSSLYAEFDWENRAQKMVLDDRGSASGLVPVGGDFYLVNFNKFGPSTHKQYTDKDGYWYVPFDDPNDQYEYVKFNAKQMATGAMQGILELSESIKDSEITSLILYINENINWHSFDDNDEFGELFKDELGEFFSHDTLDEIINAKEKTEKQIKEALKDLLDQELASNAGFPVFIHWTLIYSPEVVRAYYGNKVKETPFDCNGYPKACSKFEVLVGEDKGKSLTFDFYGRLKKINAKKEGRAEYFYDKDVTVNIPPAIEFFDFINKTAEANTSRQESDKKKRELRDFINKNKEKFEREKTDKEEVKEFINEELNKLKVEKEQAITKQERDEIQKRIDLIEQWLDVY